MAGKKKLNASEIIEEKRKEFEYEITDVPKEPLAEKPVDNDAEIDPDYFLTPLQKLLKRD